VPVRWEQPHGTPARRKLRRRRCDVFGNEDQRRISGSRDCGNGHRGRELSLPEHGIAQQGLAEIVRVWPKAITLQPSSAAISYTARRR